MTTSKPSKCWYCNRVNCNKKYKISYTDSSIYPSEKTITECSGFLEAKKITTKCIAEILSISERTLARRLNENEKEVVSKLEKFGYKIKILHLFKKRFFKLEEKV